MRILHTSDWHLGQHFMGKTRQAEHQAFCAWLIDQVREQTVDAVLIAGDIFDTGAPPSYAREQYNRFIVELRCTGCELVVLGGNHDSVAMLGESKTLLAQLGTRVIPGVCEQLDEQLLVLHRRDGSPGAILCGIPFIRPRDVLLSQAGQSAQDKQQSLQQAIQQHYQDLYALAEAKRAELGGNLPIIATGHLATVSASASDSVREIYVGSLEHIRYCGSHMPLSFDEAKQQKEVLLVELDSSGMHQISALPVPRFQPLLSLRGSLKELETAIQEAAKQGRAEQPVWLEVLVGTDDYLSDLQLRIAALCEGLPVEVLRIRRERGNASASLQGQAKETLDELSVEDVFAQRLSSESLGETEQQRLLRLYQQVVSELREGEA